MRACCERLRLKKYRFTHVDIRGHYFLLIKKWKYCFTPIDIRGHYFPLMKNGLSVHKRIFSPRNTLKADDYSFKENNILK